jgi:hypothetical protein
MAATACAYARATGKVPTSLPINHDQPLGFTPYPTVPPLPQSPTDGLSKAHARPTTGARGHAKKKHHVPTKHHPKHKHQVNKAT